MNAAGGMTVHPDLDTYYDTSTDRAKMDEHLSTCTVCQARFAKVHERLRALSCREFVELVTEFLDDAVDPELRELIEDHLRLCQGCRNHLVQMRATVATIAPVAQLEDEPAVPIDPRLLEAFRRARGR